MNETGSLRWRKSSYSPNTNCVELAELPDGTIAIRNSNHPDAGTLTFPRPAIAALIASADTPHSKTEHTRDIKHHDHTFAAEHLRRGA